MIACPAIAPENLVLAMEERSGWLVAGIAESGWLDEVSPKQEGALVDALAGFYKMAGIDLIREQKIGK